MPNLPLLIAALVLAPHAAQDTGAEPPTSRPAVVAYDPLAVADDFKVETLDLVVEYEVAVSWLKSETRKTPALIYLPASSEPAPVILFSHGLGGARTGSAFLGKHWAARGFVAVFLQHPGSDDGVWKDKPLAERMTAMRSAASAKNLKLRAADVSAVLDQLELWNADAKHALFGRLDLAHIGMSGHSFGAQTTQVTSGMASGFRGTALTDARIDAALVMSPGVPRFGSPKKAFSTVEIPWMLMTGTLDVAPIGGRTVESRREVFGALPESNPRYELVLDKAEHSAFTERALPGDQAKRNPNHHRVILALSTAFWDAYLTGDESALAWLDGAGPRGVLEAVDLWQVGRRESR